MYACIAAGMQSMDFVVVVHCETLTVSTLILHNIHSIVYF